MDIVHPRVAGIDVHKRQITVAVRLPGDGPGERRQVTKNFKTFWRGLQKMAAWLVELGVTDVAMESTSFYWWPVYHALAQTQKIEVCVCNAGHMRNVPGRKTDVSDARWIAELHEHGLLRPSFIPTAEVAALRQRTRYRKKLIEARTSERQRLAKVLEDGGIKIDSVASKLMTVSGRAMIEALIAGVRDPHELAGLAKGVLRKKHNDLVMACDGRFDDTHAQMCAAGVDGVRIEQYEQDLKNNLFKLWNRMSSGSYFPPPVKAVQIPKAGGKGVRVLGVPTVDDRIAQTVAAMYLERQVEPVFHPDSYGYRPGRSALDAVGRCRERCWKSDWVIDLDIRAFFDSVDHTLMLKAVARHTDQKWILLYVKRWLVAPLHQQDGILAARDRGTPQGSAISPVLANLFMHYAFDMWLAREFPAVAFERYCDDAVIHCASEEQARHVRDALAARLAQVGLELHPDKTRIVYCKDSNRRGAFEHTAFTFLDYTFRPRLAENRHGKRFVSFLPAVSKDAIKAMGREIRSWHIARRSDKSLGDLARMFNSIVQGWINYYGRFYKSALYPLLQRINDHLVRWAMRKYKRLRRREQRTRHLMAEASRRSPRLFAHWRFGLKPAGWTMGAV